MIRHFITGRLRLGAYWVSVVSSGGLTLPNPKLRKGCDASVMQPCFGIAFSPKDPQSNQRAMVPSSGATAFETGQFMRVN